MKKNILIISLISLLFISCENALSNIDHSSVADNPAVTATPSENGKTYISLGDIRLSTESRTINPSYIIDNLSSVYLKSKRSASDSNFGTLITNAASYSAACSKPLEIEPGIWDFRLSAYLYDFEFAGTTTIEVEAGTINTLNFDLVTTNTSSYPYGLIDITVDFTGNADKVVATLKEKSTSATAKLTKTYKAGDSTNPITSVEGEAFRRINFRTAKSSSSGVTTGKYYLLFEFFKDGDETPVNTIENIVRVENNFTTKATLNLNLDSLYSASYKFYKEDSGSNTELAVASGETLPDGVDFVISNSVLSDKISTKSTLPNLTYSGYEFAGWYKATSFTAENKITNIPGDLSSSPTLYAYFISLTTSPDLYVNSSADPDLANGSQSHPYASISAALERIEELDNATDYTIIVDGEYVSSESTSIEITKATSLTITGKTGNAADSLDAQSEGIPLIINTAVPVTVKNIKITKGSPYGIQLLSGTLTLEENTLISENKTGVQISGGEVIMTDGEISNNETGYGAGVYISYDDTNKTLGKFTMSGGTISGNTAQYGCGGGVLVDGTLYAEPEELAEYTGGDGNGHVLFTMSNGTISGNEENSTVTDDYEVGVGGGGVCVAGQYAKFVMSDSAVIKANTAPAYGAGVSVWNGAQFIMNGGTIGGSSPDDGNITGEEVEMSTYGGGVYLGGNETSSFTMNNGTISNNKCQGLGADPTNTDTRNNCGGAGVGIFYGTFTMVDGSISSNTSSRHGGGVYIAGHGIFDMQGGSISGNTCTDNGKAINQNWVSSSGVTYYGQLKMKGNAVVASNNDVYLCDKLTITGSLSGTSPIATLTPSSYTITSNSEPLIEVTTDSETSVGSEYNKFAITPDGSNNYELSNEGKLVASSNGGNSGGDPTPSSNHDYIDLGLPSGTLWATMNVGATSVTDAGSLYNWDAKFDGATQYPADDQDLPDSLDIASTDWDSNWVMPTKTQLQELYDNCCFISTTSYNGQDINGYLVFKAKPDDESKIDMSALGLGASPEFEYEYKLSEPHLFLPCNGTSMYIWSKTYHTYTESNGYHSAWTIGIASGVSDIPDFYTTDDDYYVRPVVANGATFINTTYPSTNLTNDFVLINGAQVDSYGADSCPYLENGKVNIPDLYVAKNLVTQKEFEEYMTYYGLVHNDNSIVPSETGEEKNTTPVYNVTWIDAIVYCNLRSMAEGLDPVYEMWEETDPRKWMRYYGVSNINGKYYCSWNYVPGSGDSEDDYDSYDDDTGGFKAYETSANGYRIMNVTEYAYVAQQNNSNLISNNSINEWCRCFSIDNISKQKYFTGNLTDTISTANFSLEYNCTHTNISDKGFRVVRNAQ